MQLLKKDNSVLVLALCLAAGIFLEIYRIGSSPLQEWDEARRGINAIGMIKNSDYLTYYFLDEVDAFVSKPPLATWLISVNFRLFGYNLAALRLHSVIATILFFIFAIKIVRLYKDNRFAAMVLAILVTVKGVIGFHVGRTGDTDSLLVLFLIASVYYFLRYWDFNDTRSLYLSLLFAGLAFYAKGLAILLILPGVAGIMATNWQKSKLINKNVLLSLLIFFAIAASWYFLSALGRRDLPDAAGSASLWEGLWKTDLITRFTDPQFEEGYDPWYLLTVMDTRFNIWNYVLYAGIAAWLVRLALRKSHGKPQPDRLVMVSSWLAGGMALALVASSNKHSWYFAPGYLFVAIITASFIAFLARRHRWTIYLFSALALALFARQAIDISREEAPLDDFFRKHAPVIRQADQLLIEGELPQHEILSFIIHNPLVAERARSSFTPADGDITLVLTRKTAQGQLLGQIDGLKLFRLN